MKVISFVLLGLTSVASISSISCSKTIDQEIEIPIPDPKPDPEPDPDPVEQITNLSENGLANCYIITEPGKYKFKADNQFNLGEGLPVPPEINPEDASLIWQTKKDIIKSLELRYEEEIPYIVFEVVENEGNALIGALDKEGKIVWSWHIWMPQEEIKPVVLDSGYEVMNMNLGALNNTPGDASSYGLLYQWGRKDPFPAAATLTGDVSTVSAPMFDMDGNEVKISYSSWYDTDSNNLETSISNPTLCISNYSQFTTTRDWLREDLEDNNLWGNPEGDYRDPSSDTYPNQGSKTCYDPSPAGWRVAPADVFRDFTTTGGYAWELGDFNIMDVTGDGIADMDDYIYGWHFKAKQGSLYFPAASRFDGSYAMLMGSMSGLWGNYWSNSPYRGSKGSGFCVLAFQVKDQNGNEMVTVSPSAAGSKADAYSIRCVRDN